MKKKNYGVYFRGTWGRVAFLALGGTLAGFCNGLLGAGGGIILVLFFGALLEGDREARRSVYANALCVMLPLSLFTLISYGKRGVFASGLSTELETVYMLGAAAGGILGGILLGRLGGKALGRLFALLTLISGILMMVR